MGELRIWHWLIICILVIVFLQINKNSSNKKNEQNKSANYRKSKNQSAFEKSDDKSFYSILGVLHDAEDIVIKAAYKAMAQKYHPDKFQGEAEYAKKRIQDINQAYEILSDPIERRKYDEMYREMQSDDDPQTQEIIYPDTNSFKKTRMMNWTISIVLASSWVFMLTEVSSVFQIVATTVNFGLFLGVFSFTAVSLSTESFSIFGMRILISNKFRKALQSVMFKVNIGVSLLATLILVLSFVNNPSSFVGFVGFLFYIIPLGINVRTLNSIINSTI
jgi:hypothetical protein